jgi:hypothetical protein
LTTRWPISTFLFDERGRLFFLYLQHSHDQSRRTKGYDAKAALDLLKAVESNRVYIYSVGMEPWLQYGMGLGLSEDSVQLQEVKKVISEAIERGFVDARRLYGIFEICLE